MNTFNFCYMNTSPFFLVRSCCASRLFRFRGCRSTASSPAKESKVIWLLSEKRGPWSEYASVAQMIFCFVVLSLRRIDNTSFTGKALISISLSIHTSLSPHILVRYMFSISLPCTYYDELELTCFKIIIHV